jgi:hypothetical protein
MTEAELFGAYRVASGYLAQCGCGSWIQAPSTATILWIAELVRIHNASTEHAQWAAEQEAIATLRRLPVHVCKCHGKGVA